jgi:hypothetical protein
LSRGIHFARGFNSGSALFHLDPEKAPVVFENINVVTRLPCYNRLDDRRNPARIELTVGKTGSEHFTGNLANFLIDFHQAS